MSKNKERESSACESMQADLIDDGMAIGEHLVDSPADARVGLRRQHLAESGEDPERIEFHHQLRYGVACRSFLEHTAERPVAVRDADRLVCVAFDDDVLKR